MVRKIETESETAVVIDLGTASVETLGQGGQFSDEGNGQALTGLVDE